MNAPLISILHPTARIAPSEQFPRGWKDAHDVWLARADHPENIEYLLAVHSSRWEAFQLDEIPFCAKRWQRWQAYNNTERDCVVDQLNCAAQYSRGSLLVGTMDDYYPPEHWDTLLLEALALRDLPRPELAKGSGMRAFRPDVDLEIEAQLWFSSGSPRDKELIVAGAMTRKRYERYGWCLDPDFESMFSDDWHTFVAKRDAEQGLCKLIQRFDIEFEHRHPAFTFQKMDDVYAQQNRAAAYRQGQALFFKKAYGTESIAVCLPGENFPASIFWDRVSLLQFLNAGMRFLVAPFGEHSSNVYHTRISMTRMVLNHLPSIDYVLWIDDDNSLSPEQCEMLYRDLQEHPELSGIVGCCWCDHNGKPVNDDGTPNPWKLSVGRQGSWEDGLPAWNLTLADLQKAQDEGRHLITSDDLAPDGFWSGFPVVLLRGECVRQLGPLAFAPVVNEKFIDGFTGEDASFFWRAREAGLKFGVDLRVKVNHLKLRPIEPQFIPKAQQLEALRAKGEVLQCDNSAGVPLVVDDAVESCAAD